MVKGFDKAQEAGRGVIDSLHVPAGSEYLERDLDACYAFFERDPEHGAWRGLRALNLIAVTEAERSGTDGYLMNIDPQKPVPVPWWIVCIVSLAWDKWITSQDGAHSDGESATDGEGAPMPEPPLRLGQAFDVERKPGKRQSSYEVQERDDRDRYLALAVANEGRPEANLAVETVSWEVRVSPSTVWNAWRRFGKGALKALSRPAK